MKFLTQEEAIRLDEELMGPKFRYSIDQLMELAGLSTACAICTEYSPNLAHNKRVLVVCGPGNNGGDGLVCARHLRLFGFEPVCMYPKQPAKELFQNLVAQCRMCEIPFVDFSPEMPLEERFDLVVDAIFGFSFKGDIRPPFDAIIRRIKDSKLRVVSVDIPSGWDVELGNVSGLGFEPEMLVSLSAPKKCAQHFKGKHHYLGGRFVPQQLAANFQLNLPAYSGVDQSVKLS